VVACRSLFVMGSDVVITLPLALLCLNKQHTLRHSKAKGRVIQQLNPSQTRNGKRLYCTIQYANYLDLHQ